MKLKTIVSILVSLVIAALVGVYLIALDNRYKQIYGVDYFDIWTRKTVKAESPETKEIIVDYPLSKSQHQISR